MALEGYGGPLDGSDKSLIISDWLGVRVIVSPSGCVVVSHSFGEIVSLPQTYVA